MATVGYPSTGIREEFRLGTTLLVQPNEVDSHQIHLDSSMFSLGNQSGLDERELSRPGKNLLLYALGGIRPCKLEASDFAGFGVTKRADYDIEKMYWGGMDFGDPVWGPGDQVGMILAQSEKCF